MIVKSQIPQYIMAMTRNHKLNPFGHRYYGDRRYRPIALCGHGNGHHDMFYGKVGEYQFKLYVNYETEKVMCRLLRPNEYFTV